MKKLVGQYVVKNENGTTFLTANIYETQLNGQTSYYTNEDTKYSLFPYIYPMEEDYSLSKPGKDIPEAIANLLTEIPTLMAGLG